MEASAVIIVGLILGSLLLTCILSACAAKWFRKCKKGKISVDEESGTQSNDNQRRTANLRYACTAYREVHQPRIVSPIPHRIDLPPIAQCKHQANSQPDRKLNAFVIQNDHRLSSSSPTSLSSPLSTISGSRINCNITKISSTRKDYAPIGSYHVSREKDPPSGCKHYKKRAQGRRSRP